MRSRFRRLTDLFVEGQTVLMPDGSNLWVQTINAFERDECLSDAQVAKARLVMALKNNGEERLKVEARFFEKGRDRLIEDLAGNGAAKKVPDFMEDLRDDPDWSERMNILLRTDPDETSKPLEPSELELIDQLNMQILAELNIREVAEHDFLVRKYSAATDEDVIESWVDDWLDKRGGAIANSEYQLTEMTYATRYCNAVRTDDGDLDHDVCEGHVEPFFASKADARSVPQALALLITAAIAEVNMVGRDPKGSGRPTSSSASPPTPNAVEESPPSTSTATPDAPPGT